MGFPWEVNANAFYDLLMRVQRDYDPPCMYITENGAAFYDYQQHDGSVKDPERVAFLQGYIDALGRAIEDGVAVNGLLRLVAARQLRVGARLLAAVRHRLRRLPDARATAEVERPLVQRPDRRPP